MSDNVNKIETTIEVVPARTTRRMLSFLADIFIMLILSIFTFELISFQITKAIIGYADQLSERATENKNRLDLLYENGLILKTYTTEGNLSYDFNAGSEEAFTYYLKFYVCKDTAMPNLSYTRDNNDEILAKYILNTAYSIKNDLPGINRIYETAEQNMNIYKKTNNVLDVDQDGYLIFTDKTKDLLLPALNPKDTLSSDGEKLYKTLKQNIYFGLYDKVIKDFAYGNSQYVQSTKTINEITNYVDSSVVYTTVSTYLFIAGILYFAIPLIDKKGRTLGKIFLKIEPIKKDKIETPKKMNIVYRGLIELVENLPIIIFIPVLSIGLAYCFSLYLINFESFKLSFFFVIIFGTLFDLISFIISLANSKKLTIKELASSTAIVECDLVDAYLREKEIKWELEK